jgi:hypothetical protein
MLAGMFIRSQASGSPRTAPALGQAPPGRRLATWLVVPFLLVVALVATAALSGCAGTAGGAEAQSTQPLQCPRTYGEDYVISGGCDDPQPLVRDHVFAHDEKAVAAAADALEAALGQIVAAYDDPGMLDLPFGALTPEFAAYERAVISEVEPERHPLGVELGPVGLIQREPFDGVFDGRGNGAVVHVKACWTMKLQPKGLMTRERVVEAEVRLTTPGGEPLRVAMMSAWKGEPFCPR